jgi:hypothetical protein
MSAKEGGNTTCDLIRFGFDPSKRRVVKAKENSYGALVPPLGSVVSIICSRFHFLTQIVFSFLVAEAATVLEKTVNQVTNRTDIVE